MCKMGDESCLMRSSKLVAEIERLKGESQKELERDDTNRSPYKALHRAQDWDLDLLTRPLSPLTDLGDDDDDSFNFGEPQLPDDLDMSGPSTRPSTPVRSAVYVLHSFISPSYLLMICIVEHLLLHGHNEPPIAYFVQDRFWEFRVLCLGHSCRMSPIATLPAQDQIMV